MKKNALKAFSVLVVILLLCGTFFFSGIKMSNAQATPEGTVYEYVSAVNNHNWNKVISLLVKPQQNDMKEFIKSSSARHTEAGVLNVISAKIVEIKEIPQNIANGCMQTRLYRDTYGNVHIFYVGINYRVKKESKYYLNGVNYNMIVVVPENGKWHIVEFSMAPIDYLIKTGYGFNSQEEQKALRVLEERLKGRIINYQGKLLETNIATKKQLDEEKGIYNSTTNLTTSNDHNRPSIIRVYLTNPHNYNFYGYSSPVTQSIDFYYYVKNVLPNEWIGSWPIESLKAGAIAVKMYGWYYTYYPKWPQYGADVQDNTNDQVFLTKSEYWKTTEAINDMGGIGLELQDGRLFITHYVAGYYAAGNEYSGWMWQNGTHYWANQGKDHSYMLHYYYDYSQQPGYEKVEYFYYY